jgi:hypothetical protein
MPSWKTRHRLDDNIKVKVKERIGHENVDWIHLAVNRNQQLAVVKVHIP